MRFLPLDAATLCGEVKSISFFVVLYRGEFASLSAQALRLALSLLEES